MLGASDQTRRVKNLNANWIAGPDGADGRFEVGIISEDDQHYTLAPSPASMAALIAITQKHAVLAWDPAARTFMVANLVGKVPWTSAPRP